MQRREALRILAAGSMIPALSPKMFALYRQAQPAAGYALRTLDAHQNDTVVAMIDTILPATETPGAKEVRVNEFIDVILTEWANDDERSMFLKGLADVDAESNKLYGKDFAAASAEQQLVLLRAMDEEARMIRVKKKDPPPFWEPEGRDRQFKDDFFTVFKRLTLHGYYTSEVGFEKELKLKIIPGEQHGCTDMAPGGGDASAGGEA
jgi:Gluconate 2-dehydrogenase subunit 3